jgi:hypothetical protein
MVALLIEIKGYVMSGYYKNELLVTAYYEY